MLYIFSIFHGRFLREEPTDTANGSAQIQPALAGQDLVQDHPGDAGTVDHGGVVVVLDDIMKILVHQHNDATASFFKSGAMNVKVGVLAAVGSFAGSALGANIVLMLSDEMLRTMMFIVLPLAAAVILWQRNLPDENKDDGTLNLKKTLLALGIGLGIGLYDGIVGPGTGTFAIIAFTTLMGFDLRTANGNGKVLNLASNYASLFTYLVNGLVVFHVAIPCAISNILGNLLGSHFALKKGARFIRPMMLVVLVLLLAKLLSDAVL